MLGVQNLFCRTDGLWKNNEMHPGGVPPVISIERFSINASAATPPGSGDWTFCDRPGAEESSVRGEMRPKLTFRVQKVNETCDWSSMV